MSVGILYTCICCSADCSLVAEYARRKGNIASNIHRILPLVSPGAQKHSFQHETDCYSILRDASYLYVCVTTLEDIRLDVVYRFLEKVREEIRSLTPEGTTAYFSILKKQADYFSDPNNDRISRTMASVEQVKQQMAYNVESALLRGEQIDNLIGQTEALETQGKTFETHAKKARKVMGRKCCWITIILILMLLLLATILTVGLCSRGGFNVRKCIISSGGNATKVSLN